MKIPFVVMTLGDFQTETIRHFPSGKFIQSMRSSRIPIAVIFTPYGAKNRNRFTMTPTWLNLEHLSLFYGIYMDLSPVRPVPWFHGQKRLPIKYHHQVCSTTKYHIFSPLKGEIEVYLSLSRHKDAFFEGSKTMSNPIPTWWLEQADGTPQLRPRPPSVGLSGEQQPPDAVRCQQWLDGMIRCQKWLGADDNNEMLGNDMQSTWSTWTNHENIMDWCKPEMVFLIGGVKPSKVRWTHGPGTP